MQRSRIYALVIIAVAVIVMIFNADSDSVDLLFTKMKIAKAVMYLVYMSLGVAVGLLLK